MNLYCLWGKKRYSNCTNKTGVNILMYSKGHENVFFWLCPFWKGIPKLFYSVPVAEVLKRRTMELHLRLHAPRWFCRAATSLSSYSNMQERFEWSQGLGGGSCALGLDILQPIKLWQMYIHSDYTEFLFYFVLITTMNPPTRQALETGPTIQ